METGAAGVPGRQEPWAEHLSRGCPRIHGLSPADSELRRPHWAAQGRVDRIFDVCNEIPYDILADCVLRVDFASQECATVPKTDRFPGNNAVVVCTVAPVIAVLREHLPRSSPLAARRGASESSEEAAVEGRFQ